MNIHAVVPVKEFSAAKQRLAGFLSETHRQALALAMLEDVLETLADCPLASVIVVTADEAASRIAAVFGATVWREGARESHTGAVATAAARLARDGAGMVTIPADIPLVRPADIRALLAASPFAIAPSCDERGTNAVLAAPADLVTLRFGEDSFVPHLAAARARGLVPAILRLPNVALDLDRPADIVEFLKIPSRTRARALLEKACLEPSRC
jgi:2-phospho-L-lactate/phosphoenolpyruvate guanylyltransferase